MKNKLFNYGIPVGLTSSMIGFILLKADLLTADQSNFIYTLYKLTLLLTVIFILTKSSFLKEKFNQIAKVVGVIVVLIFGMYLLQEFNIYKINSIEIVSYILFCSLYSMYLSYFLKKTDKTRLDILKLGLLSFAFIGGFLDILNFDPNHLNYITGGLFWIVVIGMLFYGSGKKEENRNYVG